MESSLLNPNRKGCCRILQLTDMHLFADKEAELLGVKTFDSFATVLTRLQSSRYDMVLVTGDVVQDHSLLGYQHFVSLIESLGLPCYWVTGNHDESVVMQQILQQSSLLSECKVIFLKEKWLLVLLDSTVVGEAYGELSLQQLQFLMETLTRYSTRQALIVLHHHPVASGCAWLDNHILKNHVALYRALQAFPQANTLVCGHIHQALNKKWYDKQVFATPSTCVQFKPECLEFTLDILPPGWREFTLYDDGSLSSEVFYLTCGQFIPDLKLKGY